MQSVTQFVAVTCVASHTKYCIEMDYTGGQSDADSASADPKCKMLPTCATQSAVKQAASDKTILQHSNHLKHANKSKSLDMFDRPTTRLHLARFISLSNMSSIPEDSCMQPVYNHDDMKVNHRSPVSIENGYRPSASIGNHVSKYTLLSQIFKVLLHL